MPVSKTDFVRALQCEKMLWLDAHMPELKIIPPEVQARLDAGNEFGDKAMSIFGEYVETTTLKEDGRLDYATMLEKTKTLLQAGTPVICEGAFSWYGNYCAADILKKDGEKYALYEVKNTTEIRKEFLVDLGFQRLILRKCGIPLSASFLVLRCDESAGQVCIERAGERYKIVDVTKESRSFERIVDSKIFVYGKIKKRDAVMPDIPVGEQCEKPYRCWYYGHCHKDCPRE